MDPTKLAISLLELAAQLDRVINTSKVGRSGQTNDLSDADARGRLVSRDWDFVHDCDDGDDVWVRMAKEELRLFEPQHRNCVTGGSCDPRLMSHVTAREVKLDAESATRIKVRCIV